MPLCLFTCRSAERCIQIWERDSGLTLHATGEAAHGLLPLLAWQPNGRHLYTVHLPPDTAAQRPLEGTPNNPRGVRAAARAAAAAAAVPIASSKAAVGATDKRSAASQTGAPTPRVMLMERNGLQHGGFDLACSGSIDSVTWSCDSEMLSVVQRATQEENAPWLLQVGNMTYQYCTLCAYVCVCACMSVCVCVNGGDGRRKHARWS